MSKDDLTLLSLLVHVPFVTAWIGLVMFDAFAIVSPGLTLEQRGRFIARTRWLAAAAMAVILLTGVWQTMENPFLKVDSWSTLERLRDRTYGQALFYKHLFVIATIVLTFVTRFIMAPRLVAVPVGVGLEVASSPGETLRKRIAALTLANLVACFAAVTLAARMAIELH